MKTELMIGSIVSLTEDETSMPCAIVELRSDTVLVRPLGCKDCEAVGYNQIFPVPLTPEILEANGIAYFGEFRGYSLSYLYNQYRWYFDEGKVKIVQDLQDGTFSLSYGLNLIINLTGVHQLQNALKVCGLAELADNFKITQ